MEKCAENTWTGLCPALTQVTYYLLTGNLLTFSLRSGETFSLTQTQQQGREKVAQVWEICTGVAGVTKIISDSLMVYGQEEEWLLCLPVWDLKDMYIQLQEKVCEPSGLTWVSA